jgi:ribosomal protein S27E
MSVFFHLANTYRTLKSLARECPKCGRQQVAARSQIKEAVRCKHCGAEIPPPRAR